MIKYTEAQEIIDYCITAYNLQPIKLKVKTVRRGRAHYLRRYITLPNWIYTQGLSYFYYYVLHEVSHFIYFDKFGGWGHGGGFKEIERQLLKEWDLIPEYKKAYVKKLFNSNGQELFSLPY